MSQAINGTMNQLTAGISYQNPLPAKEQPIQKMNEVVWDQMQQAVCPAMKSILDLTPEVAGRLIALSEKASDILFNNEFVYWAFSRIGETAVTTNNYIVETTSGALDLSTVGASAYQLRNRVGPAVAVTVLAFQALGHLLREDPQQIVRGAPGFVGNALSATVGAAWSGVKTIAYLPIAAILGTPRAIYNLAKMILTSKAVWFAASYTGFSSFYNSYCERPNEPSFIDKTIAFYKKKRNILFRDQIRAEKEAEAKVVKCTKDNMKPCHDAVAEFVKDKFQYTVIGDRLEACSDAFRSTLGIINPEVEMLRDVCQNEEYVIDLHLTGTLQRAIDELDRCEYEVENTCPAFD